MGKLNERGCINPNTECPFKDECPCVGTCHHRGLDHNCEFSCGLARLIEIILDNKKRK